MDILSAVPEVLSNVYQGYEDYQKGRKMRLGQYKGSDNVKQLGHYNTKTNKRLAIYHA